MTVAAECAALAAIAGGNDSWQKLGWGGANPVGVRTFAIAPGTNNAALVQQIQLYGKGLRGA